MFRKLSKKFLRTKKQVDKKIEKNDKKKSKQVAEKNEHNYKTLSDFCGSDPYHDLNDQISDNSDYKDLIKNVKIKKHLSMTSCTSSNDSVFANDADCPDILSIQTRFCPPTLPSRDLKFSNVQTTERYNSSRTSPILPPRNSKIIRAKSQRETKTPKVPSRHLKFNSVKYEKTSQMVSNSLEKCIRRDTKSTSYLDPIGPEPPIHVRLSTNKDREQAPKIPSRDEKPRIRVISNDNLSKNSENSTYVKSSEMASSNVKTCKICCKLVSDENRSVIFINCGHMIGCMMCESNLKNKCPVCMTVGSPRPVFFC
jgi:hypothetical protein